MPGNKQDSLAIAGLFSVHLTKPASTTYNPPRHALDGLAGLESLGDEMKITKAEYDALPEMMKGLYKADGEGYVATFKTAEEHEQEVSGLKQQNAALIGEKKDAKKKAEEAEAERLRLAEEANIKNGDVDALRTSYEKKLADQKTGFEAQIQKLTGTVTSLTVGSAAKDLSAQLFGKNAAIAGHLVSSRLTMEDVNGVPTVRVLGADGKPSAATLEDLAKEIRGNAEYASVLVAPASGTPAADNLNDVSSNTPLVGNTMTSKAIELAKNA